jgi:5-methylcytosine-specific restriction protein B
MPEEAPLEQTPLERDDPVLQETRALLQIYGGVIYSGPPGTGKSWYARRIGWTLAEGEEDRIVFLQFHPSYQYEDFVQGVAPRKDGRGFEPIEKPFIRMCRAAEEDPDRSYVIVIDELSRADPGRVFGEALTYIEKSKRGLQFQLAMDEEVARVPDNLVILATMNPLDRGVDEVDAAFERRFAKIAMDPDVSVVEEFLRENEVDEELRRRIVSFFRKTNDRARQNPLASVGHTFFMNVTDAASLRQLWKHQLRFLFEKAYRLNLAVFEEIEGDWQDIYRDRPGERDDPTTT